MQVTISPNPCAPGQSYTVTAAGGTPPYYYELMSSPPNPPGVVLVVDGGVAHVQVPGGTPANSQISVAVADSGDPRQGKIATNRVG